jgi:hypothetical protein
MRSVCSTAFEASHVLLSTGGTFCNATVTLDPALASGTYYIAVLDASAYPGDATDITAASVTRLYLKPVVHTTGASEDVSFGGEQESTVGGSPGYRCAKGCVVLLSSTAPTSITGSAHAWINGSVA